MSRLQHDTAFATATSIIEVFEHLLREEEQADAFAEIYQRVKAGIECYDQMKSREETRLKPSKN